MDVEIPSVLPTGRSWEIQCPGHKANDAGALASQVYLSFSYFYLIPRSTPSLFVLLLCFLFFVFRFVFCFPPAVLELTLHTRLPSN